MIFEKKWIVKTVIISSDHTKKIGVNCRIIWIFTKNSNGILKQFLTLSRKLGLEKVRTLCGNLQIFHLTLHIEFMLIIFVRPIYGVDRPFYLVDQ